MMTIEDHEILVRHENRPFQDAVPPNLVRELLEEARAGPFMAPQSAEVDDRKPQGWGDSRGRIRRGHFPLHAGRGG
jgi:hypothetical protein